MHMTHVGCGLGFCLPSRVVDTSNFHFESIHAYTGLNKICIIQNTRMQFGPLEDALRTH